jgi:hypothetical protein
VAVLQMGVVPEQLVLVRHCTHLLVVVSQTGVVPEQVELSVHCTHAPVAEHAGWVVSKVAHWLAAVHAAHVWVAVAQMGVAPEQFAPVRHWTHLFVEVSHTGVAPEQSVLAVHWTHAPVAEQTGWAASRVEHWVDVVQAVQVPLALAQMGVVAGHVALVRQPTQAPLVAQRVRVGSLSVAHCAAVVQAVQAPPEQIGALAGQVALFKHWTHLLAVVSQTGVAPEHVVLSVHWTHAPVAEHAGRAGVAAAHWAATVQTVHVPAPKQIGVVAGQVALVRHWGIQMSGLLASTPLSTAGPLSVKMGLSMSGRLSAATAASMFWPLSANKLLSMPLSTYEGTSMGKVASSYVTLSANTAPSANFSQPGAPRPSQTQTCRVRSQRRPLATPAWVRHWLSLVHVSGSNFLGKHAASRRQERMAMRMARTSS